MEAHFITPEGTYQLRDHITLEQQQMLHPLIGFTSSFRNECCSDIGHAPQATLQGKYHFSKVYSSPIGRVNGKD